MSYTKQNFEDGQVLTAEQLNHIEDGVATIDARTITVTHDGTGNVTLTIA